MKLWKKICICSLLFFLLIFLGSGIVIIENNKKIMFHRILQQASGDQAGISSGIMRYVIMNRVKEATGNGSRDRDYIIEYLGSRMNVRGIYLEIRDMQEVLYSNLEFAVPEIHQFSLLTEYRIEKIKDKKYLILTSPIPLKNRNLMSTFIVDINTIFTDRIEQYSFFLKLAAAVSVVLLTGMYFITKHLTASLNLLTLSVKKMKEGNYKERVEIHSKDEVGQLAESYNSLAEAIEKKIQELESKTMEQQRFIDNFTHELRTPLTAVVGYADLLRSTSYEEDFAQEMGERIFREGKRIQKLSELMMDIIFLERHSFHLVPCDIGKVITEGINIFKPTAAKMRMKVIGILPEGSASILAEKDLLFNLLGNLIDNAIKASKEGDTITIRGYRREDNVILEVEDYGKGIPKEEISRVFESFYMVDKVRNRKNKGVGLGLSICADIVKIHKAKIELFSEENKGTLIKISFPCYK